ncbi:MAG: hypothetical protein KatS3mg110_2176 [Pirellulaceae bacterium]|nr:MAG: hypothetical protein KatS3mg110_2176 [Pirellulaceae bacterium]
MRKRVLQSGLIALGLFWLTSAGVLVAPAEETISFRRDVAPILVDNCLPCHGAKKAESGYRVDTYERLMAEGDSGAAGFVPKDTDGSEAFRRMVSDDPAERMPWEADPLPPEKIEIVRRWIEQGARYDGEDPKALLTSIIPPPVYPKGPEKYAFPVPVTALAWNADGNELYSSGYHEICVWNPVDGALLRRIENVPQRTMALALSPDGQLLAVGGGSPGRLGEVRIYETGSGQLERVLVSTTDVVLDVAFSPKGDRLAVAGADNILRIIEVATGKEILTITSHSDWVTAVAWNQDGTQLASASRDKTAKVFDVEKGELLVTYSGHNQPVRGVAFHPDGKQVYSSGADNKIHRWNIADGKKAAEASLGGEVYRLVVCGDMLVATSADRTARLYKLDNLEQIRSLSGHGDWVLSAAAHSASRRLATGAFNGEVRVWNLDNGELVKSFVASPGL